jgi:MFS family permease
MMAERGGIFYGWYVVGALFVVGMLGPMGRYAITAFSPFIRHETGWGATTIGLTISIGLWLYAFASLPVGWMIDRMGSRKIILLGGMFLLIGLYGFSKVHTPRQLHVFAGLVVGIGVSMTHFLVTQSTARRWFVRRAGLVGGLLTSAFWIGSGGLTPLLTLLADAWGWRTACLVYALGASAVIFCLGLLVIRDSPESLGLLPDGRRSPATNSGEASREGEVHWSFGEAVKTRSFLLLFVAISLVGMPGQGLLGHLVLWGVQLGTAKATAGVFMTALSFGCAFSSVFGGWLGDRLGKRVVLSLAYGTSGLVLFLAWAIARTPGRLMVVTGLFGLTYGASAGPGLWGAYVGDIFGRDPLGRLMGILFFGYGLVGGSGPLIWGRIYDLTGSYNTACLASALCLLIVTCCMLMVKPVVKPS